MSTMLNTITDAIISRADKYNAEVIIEDTFEDDNVLRKITQKEFIEYIVPSMDD